MKGLIGKKVGMTRVFTPEGQSVGVTVILAGPNVIAQVKTLEKDGYSAVQLGFGAKRHPNLPEAGHALKQAGWFKLSAKADPGAAPPEDAPDFKGARAKGLLSSFKAIRELRVQGPSGLAELKGALLEENP